MMRFDNVFFESAAGTKEQLPSSDVPEVAFAGRSNVGKSSLLNKLFNRKALARVSATPGKTITINFYRLENSRMVDLPGYGYAKVSQSEKMRWSGLLDGYFASGRNLRLVVQLVDMRHKPTADDLVMIRYLKEMGFPFIVAMTKSDKLNKTQYKERLSAMPDELGLSETPDICIPFSSEKGEGVEKVRECIENAVTQ